MTAQFTHANATNQSTTKRNALLGSIKYKMLALKDFEECHVLAGWIRQLFFDMFEQQRGQDKNGHSPEAAGEDFNIPNSEALDTVGDISMALDVDSIIADIPRPAPWELPYTMSNDNILWHNWLLGYQDGG